MRFKETINNHPVAVGTATVVVIVICGWVAIRSSMRPSGAVRSPKAFFTDDDGATWFEGAADMVPPFDHGGRTAFHCQVFTCDGGATKFVGFLDRCTPAGKELMQSIQGKPQNDPQVQRIVRQVEQYGSELKRPQTGDAGWVSRNDPQAAEIMNVHCPDNANPAVRVLP